MTHAERVAERFGVTVEQARAQYAKNARGLRAMERKALASKSGTHNGYAARELKRHATRFDRFAGTCDDCERAYGPHYGTCRCSD